MTDCIFIVAYYINTTEMTQYIYIYIYIHTHAGFWWGNLRLKEHWVDPGVDGRIILIWIIRKWDVGV